MGLARASRWEAKKLKIPKIGKVGRVGRLAGSVEIRPGGDVNMPWYSTIYSSMNHGPGISARVDEDGESFDATQ